MFPAALLTSRDPLHAYVCVLHSLGLLRSLLPLPPVRDPSAEKVSVHELHTRPRGQHLLSPTSPSRDVLLVEMVARTLKNILRRWMREGVLVFPDFSLFDYSLILPLLVCFSRSCRITVTRRSSSGVSRVSTLSENKSPACLTSSAGFTQSRLISGNAKVSSSRRLFGLFFLLFFFPIPRPPQCCRDFLEGLDKWLYL